MSVKNNLGSWLSAKLGQCSGNDDGFCVVNFKDKAWRIPPNQCFTHRHSAEFRLAFSVIIQYFGAHGFFMVLGTSHLVLGMSFGTLQRFLGVGNQKICTWVWVEDRRPLLVWMLHFVRVYQEMANPPRRFHPRVSQHSWVNVARPDFSRVAHHHLFVLPTIEYLTL